MVCLEEEVWLVPQVWMDTQGPKETKVIEVTTAAFVHLVCQGIKAISAKPVIYFEFLSNFRNRFINKEII